VAFHGRLPDAEVTRLVEGCRALVLPGSEDFGLTPVEAHAAGKPVIAYAAGGALETVEEGRTGTFFPRHDPSDVLDAIERCDAIAGTPEEIAASAQRFSRAAFRARLDDLLEERVRAHRKRLAATRRFHRADPQLAAAD
jgi:glycosyltransferase involved in cell wall biosynthesis